MRINLLWVVVLALIFHDEISHAIYNIGEPCRDYKLTAPRGE